MNKATIEAIFRRDMKNAKETYDALVDAAERQRDNELQKLEEERRAEYLYEQRFFFQG